MIQKKIKKSKARKLFRKNAFIIGLVDGVLATTAAEYFGDEAVSKVRRMRTDEKYVTQVFPGDGYVDVLTYHSCCRF